MICIYIVCAFVSQCHELHRVWVVVGRKNESVFKQANCRGGTEGPVYSSFEVRDPLACHSCLILRSFCCMHLILTSETARNEYLGGLKIHGH